MSAIGARLLGDLRSVQRSGAFCVGGTRGIFMPAIDVDGVGRLAFPVLSAQAEQLVGVAATAPYGRGEETIVDRDVRRTWQVDSAAVRIGGRQWEKTLGNLVAQAALGLGVNGPVSADFYKLLVYDAGGFFVDHRDTEKVPGMFATMVLVLPSVHGGGELVVKHAGRETPFDLHPEEPSEIGFAAFYADCVHEVRPVTAGFRIVLIYNLRFADGSRPQAPDYRNQQAQATETLRNWASTANEPLKLILPLEHAYTPAELSFATLKGADAGVASVLVESAATADCDLHLALVSIEESGIAEHTGYHDRRRWRDDEDGDAFEAVEVDERELILSDWRRPDGGEAGFDKIPFTEDELCPPDAFQNLAPDEEHFHEATGNEGASFERAYRRAGLVLWPVAHRLAVLDQAGLDATLPHLESLTAHWEAEGFASQSPSWREADALSGLMLDSWPRADWRRDDDTRLGRMLDAQARLRNVKRIDEALVGLSAEGCYAPADNAPLVRAAALLSPARATELLIAILVRNAPDHLGACGDLLLRAVAASVGDLKAIADALIDALPGDSTEPVEGDEEDDAEDASWAQPPPVEPGFVVDLVSAASRIAPELALRATERVLASPKTYAPDDVLTHAALAIAKLGESKSWPAATRLREAALDHLRGRIALPLAPPPDWTRDNPVRCRCAECLALGAFLIAPDQQQWRLKALQARRTHVENTIRNAFCDLDLATERHGSPHTLVATKNEASYRRRADQRRQDLEHVSALGG
jgi:predicted 2-oxoglutarate/Fe(II)-dependent dioxygenase YbiX